MHSTASSFTIANIAVATIHMNAKELLQCAPRLSESNRAYVILDNCDRGVIVPPGATGKEISVRSCDADGVQSGPVKKVSPKDLRLEPLPAPPAPLRLALWCVPIAGRAKNSLSVRIGPYGPILDKTLDDL